MKVKEAMKVPIVVEKDISLSEAAQIMSSKRIGSLIFFSSNRIKGIVTDTDLVKNFAAGKKISDIMSKNVIAISPDENLEEAVIKMRKSKIKRLPVIDKDKLVGIISMTDLLANAEEIDEDFFFD